MNRDMRDARATPGAKGLAPHPATAGRVANPRTGQRMEAPDIGDRARALAVEAMTLVRTCHRRYLPARAMQQTVDDVFKFYGDEQRDIAAYKEAYRSCLGDMERALGRDIDIDELLPNLFGFVPPALPGRKVHVKRSVLLREVDQLGGLAHEYIHYLSHENLLPKLFTECPPTGFFKVEGITEILTVMACSAPATGVHKPTLINARSTPHQPHACWEEYFATLTWEPLTGDGNTARLIAYGKPYASMKSWVKKRYPAARRALNDTVSTGDVPSRLGQVRAAFRERHPTWTEAYLDHWARVQLQRYAFQGVECDLSGIVAPTGYTFG